MSNLARIPDHESALSTIEERREDAIAAVKQLGFVNFNPAHEAIFIDETGQSSVIPLRVVAMLAGGLIEVSPGRCLVLVGRAGHLSIVDAPATGMLRGGEA
jgi:hypothetical protein